MNATPYGSTFVDRRSTVCQISLENGLKGIGFLIGKDLILTNNFVLPNDSSARKAEAIFFNITAQEIHVSLDPDTFFYTCPIPGLIGFVTIVSIHSDPRIAQIEHLALCIFDPRQHYTEVCFYLQMSGQLGFVAERYEACQVNPAYIRSLNEQELYDFMQIYRYSSSDHKAMRLMASCLWQDSGRDIETLTNFFKWLCSGNIDIAGGYQTEMILACLSECRSAQLEEIVWEACEIARFVSDVLKYRAMRPCLIRFMKISERVFVQVRDAAQEKGGELLDWFLKHRTVEKKAPHEDKAPPPTLDQIQEALDHKSPWVRRDGLKALGKTVAKMDGETLPILLRWVQLALKDRNKHVREQAVEVLENIMAHPSSTSLFPIIVDELYAALNSGDEWVVYPATIALRRIATYANAENTSEILNPLQAALKHEDPRIRAAAASSLGEMAEKVSEEWTPAILDWLHTALSDEDGIVREAITKALGKFAARSSQEDVSKILNWMHIGAKVQDMHPSAALLSGVPTPVPKESAPNVLVWICGALSNTDWDVLQAAVEALEKIVAHLDPQTLLRVLGWIQTNLKHKNYRVRLAAAQALEKMAPYAAREFLPELLDGIQTTLIDVEEVRLAGLEALYRLNERTLTFILRSTSQDYLHLKPFIFEHFIGQCIPIFKSFAVDESKLGNAQIDGFVGKADRNLSLPF
jgi:HEAT repeat protein